MKTWEVIKALTEKPYKKFRSTNESLVTEIYVNEKGCIELYYPGLKVGSNNLKLDTDWEEVKEPVDFMEVLKRIKDSDGDIRLMLINDLYEVEIKNKTFDKVLYNLSIDYLDTSIADILLNGKWYIEED